MTRSNAAIREASIGDEVVTGSLGSISCADENHISEVSARLEVLIIAPAVKKGGSSSIIKQRG